MLGCDDGHGRRTPSARHVGLVDPTLRTLEVYAREGARWLLLAAHADDAVVRAEPFTALEFNLDALWLRKR